MSEGGPTYLSYLLRVWRVSDNGKPVWRASLQSAETGERVGFAGLEELFEYLRWQMAVATDQKHKKGGIKMWINMTTLKVDPSNVDKVNQILKEACQNVCQDVPEELRGREGYRLQSAQDPGTIVSLTIWDDQERQVKMMQGEAYVNLVKQQLMPLLLARPERAGFYVLGHTVPESCQEAD